MPPREGQTEEIAGATLHAALLADVLRRFGEARVCVYGSSMLPSVRPGDVLVVERERPQGIQRGDIVLFSRAGRFFAHRVVETVGKGGEEFLVTKGDFLAERDPLLAPADVLGRVRAIRRGRSETVLDSPGQRIWSRLVLQLSRLRGLWTLPVRLQARLRAMRPRADLAA